jgi:hypothetical protein
MPLQVIPQRFSSVQAGQIMNPHVQVQQKGCSFEHAQHTYLSGRRHLPFRPSSLEPLICPLLSRF